MEVVIADKEEGLSGNIFMFESISSCFISADNLFITQNSISAIFCFLYFFFSQRLLTK